MGFFSSFKKNSKLAKLSKVLGKEFSMSDYSSDKFSDLILSDNPKDKALEELLDLCEQDKTLKGIMDVNDAAREDLKKIYHEIELNGAGQWTRGHYVAASALAFGTTLDFCLNAKSKGLSEREIAFTLVDYYENNRVGKIDI